MFEFTLIFFSDAIILASFFSTNVPSSFPRFCLMDFKFLCVFLINDQLLSLKMTGFFESLCFD